ncbi:MAG: hypothetical protein GC155_02725 [Alphaproteobacteria bacterium]|nr:hypothetical protein [Alphaproteobacteria bacterium]
MARNAGINLGTRLALAGAVLAVGLATVLTAAQLGVVNLGAGEMGISVRKGEQGLTMDIGSRSCPPKCGLDFNWRPVSL